MLLAALRSDGPLAGKALVFDEDQQTFTLTGIGEIPAAKVLDLEDRRQFVWGDPVTREWALETAGLRVRREAAAAAVSHQAAADQAGAGVDAPAQQAADSTLVFEPPPAGPKRPVAMPAGPEAPAPVDHPPAPAVSSDLEPADTPAADTGPAASADVVSRHAERRSSPGAAGHRRGMSAARLRIVLYVVSAILVAIVLFLVQRGGL